MKRFSRKTDFGRSGSLPANPDFTDAVMGRLGFERTDSSTARRERLRFRNVRAGSVVFLVVVVLFGVLWEWVGQEMVAKPTLPAAVNQSQAVRTQALAGLAAPFQQLERALDTAMDSWGAVETLGIERIEIAPEPVDAPEHTGTSSPPLDEKKAIAPFSRS